MKNKALLTILAGSIAQLVHGATIETNSPVTGDWSDPLSWNGGVVPDTYGNVDSAIIHAGDVIDYDGGVSTPGGIVGPGGLSVIAGNSITIEGGTLTQNVRTNEIRIGEGSGGAGDGILTINGGLFNSGAAVAVAIGASLGGGPGSGIVNVNDGTFIMGAGAATGGLVVGVDGSTGVFNLGDGIGVAGTAVLDLATSNIGLGIGYFFAGPVGGTGTVAIKSDGVLNLGTSGIVVGNGGGTATLSINGGSLIGLATGGGSIVIGDGDGSTGSLIIDANGSLSNSGQLRIGSNGGTGTLTMSSGTLTVDSEFNVGAGVGALVGNGQANISGGTVTVGQTLIGRDGAMGTLTLSGTASMTTNGNFYIGTAGSVGTVSMTGGTLASTGVIEVGASGAGTMAITAGTVTSGGETRVGQGAAGVGTLDFSGTANWTSNGEFQIGNDGGSGIMNMSGGDLTANTWVAIGRTGGTGVLNLSGGTITKGTSANTGSFDIGSYNGGNAAGPVSTGTLVQTGGAIVDTVADFNLGRDANTVGIWNMSGGTATFASGDPATTGQNVRIGNSGTGTATFTGGVITGIKNLEAGSNAGAIGVINVNYAQGTDTLPFDQLYLGYGAGASGTVNVSKGTLDLGAWSEIGRNGGTGTVNIVGADSHFLGSGSDMQIGYGNGAIGSVNITDGGSFVHNWWINLGRNGDATGNIVVDGAGSTLTQTAGRLNLGGDPNTADTGKGFVTISNGGHFEHAGDEMNYGTHAGSVGVMTINTGGTFNSTGGQTHIGNAGGTGTLNVTGAGSSFTVNDETFVGIGNGSTGTVNLDDGGAITINQWLNVGRDGGTGTLNQTGGTMFVLQEARIGWGTNGTGTFNISSGTFTSGSTTDIGDGAGSVGTLNLSGDAVMTSNGEFWTGNGNGTGITNIDGGSIIANSWFDLGRNSGTGTVNLNSGSITKLTTTGQMNIGSSGTGHGTLNQAGGTITNTVVDTLIARDPDTVGEWNFTGGTATLANLLVGAAGHGTLNVTGTNAVSLTANQILVGGQNGNTGVGTINISNPNAVITSTNEAGIGRNGGHGEVHQSAGTVNVGGGWFGIANDPQDGSQPVSGLYDISGGQLNVLATNIELGADGAGELRITGTAQVTANNIHVAQRTHGTGTLTIADTATLAASGQIVVGYGSANANVANVSGGTISSGTETVVGQGINGGIPNVGTLNLTGPATWTSGGEFQVGNDGGTGVANISAGTIIAKNYVAIGRNTDGNGGLNGGNGVVNLSGTGVIQKVADNGGTFDIGSWNGGNAATTNTTGTLNQDGGSIINTVSDTHIGRDAGVVGMYNMLSGSATLARLNVGNDGIGTLNMTGGNISAADRVTIANGGTSTGTANLNGGILATRFVEAGAGVATLNLNGGTLQALADEGDFLRNINPANSELLAGGVTFDTNGFNVAINNQFDGVGGITKIGAGSLTISAPQTLSALTVSAGAVILGETNHLGALSLATGTTVTLSTHVGGPANVKAIDTSSLTLAGTARLDLTNNAMVVRGGDYATINASIASGFNNGDWTGAGINSSTAATNPDANTAIGILNNADINLTEFAGVTGLTGNEILLKYTYYGDSDLSGQVTSDDLSLFVGGYAGGNPASWLNGDYDYSGAVTADDLSLFVGAYASNLPALRDPVLADQLNNLVLGLKDSGGSDAISALSSSGGDLSTLSSGSDVGAGQAVVPEPGSISLLAAGALGLLARRRRTNRGTCA